MRFSTREHLWAILFLNVIMFGVFSFTFAATPTGKPISPYYAVGDSIAEDLIQIGVPGTAKIGIGPSQILGVIGGIPAEKVRGKTVILSSGASNTGTKTNPGDVKVVRMYVPLQIQKLKGYGAKVILLGVGPGINSQMNGVLAEIAQKEGAFFTQLTKTTDGVHPSPRALLNSLGSTASAENTNTDDKTQKGPTTQQTPTLTTDAETKTPTIQLPPSLTRSPTQGLLDAFNKFTQSDNQAGNSQGGSAGSMPSMPQMGQSSAPQQSSAPSANTQGQMPSLPNVPSLLQNLMTPQNLFAPALTNFLQTDTSSPLTSMLSKLPLIVQSNVDALQTTVNNTFSAGTVTTFRPPSPGTLGVPTLVPDISKVIPSQTMQPVTGLSDNSSLQNILSNLQNTLLGFLQKLQNH